MAVRFQVACLCAAVSQEVQLRNKSGSDAVPLSLCHCDTCRHTSGLLCTSYYPITTPDISSNVRIYHSSGASTRYFCGTCGCHVFQSKQAGESELEWGVATGTVMCLSGQASAPASYSSHQHIADTKDGGLSIWMRELGNPSDDHESSTYENSTDETLQASCACGNVKFHVTRPNDSSRVPKRNFPDLMFADKTTPDEFKQNVGDEKWWIQDAGQKYLAGTCACRSCRLVSGYEIQTWAFVPRTNIFFHAPDADGERIIPLDFNTLPPGILTTYTSSSNVGREFCGTCGASVFWHQKDPDDVIDISVGLLRAPEGARAENWLKWWRGRVSFVEDVDYKRDGLEAKTASQLIHMLEKGMQEA